MVIQANKKYHFLTEAVLKREQTYFAIFNILKTHGIMERGSQ